MYKIHSKLVFFLKKNVKKISTQKKKKKKVSTQCKRIALFTIFLVNSAILLHCSHEQFIAMHCSC